MPEKTVTYTTANSPIVLELSDAAHEIVAKLHETGLYGMTRAEVCERLLIEKLRTFVRVEPIKLPKRGRRR